MLLGVKSGGRSSARGVLRLRRCAGMVPLLLQGAHANPSLCVCGHCRRWRLALSGHAGASLLLQRHGGGMRVMLGCACLHSSEGRVVLCWPPGRAAASMAAARGCVLPPAQAWGHHSPAVQVCAQQKAGPWTGDLSGHAACTAQASSALKRRLCQDGARCVGNARRAEDCLGC